MHPKLLLCLTLLVSCLPYITPSALTAEETSYATYVNPRFGFRLTYPKDLIPSREPDNGAGRSFSSADGEFSVTAQGHFLNGATLDSFWTREMKSKGSTVTYSVKKKSFYVVSGTRDGMEYHRKVFVKDGNWMRFDIVYPTPVFVIGTPKNAI